MHHTPGARPEDPGERRSDRTRRVLDRDPYDAVNMSWFWISLSGRAKDRYTSGSAAERAPRAIAAEGRYARATMPELGD